MKSLCFFLILLCLAACTPGSPELEEPEEVEEIEAIEELEESPEPDEPRETRPRRERIPRSPSEVSATLSPDGGGLTPIQYDARYAFEQVSLPQALLQIEAQVIEYIYTANVEGMREHVLSSWNMAGIVAILRNLFSVEERANTARVLELQEESYELRLEHGLGDEHILDITFEEIDAETNAFIIRLLDTDKPWLSTHIGIAHNETMGLQIFTLERIQDFDGLGRVAHMFCFINLNSRGSFHVIENEKETFIAAIHDAMNDLIDPAGGFFRPI